jgi:hypothetical protein
MHETRISIPMEIIAVLHLSRWGFCLEECIGEVTSTASGLVHRHDGNVWRWDGGDSFFDVAKSFLGP